MMMTMKDKMLKQKVLNCLYSSPISQINIHVQVCWDYILPSLHISRKSLYDECLAMWHSTIRFSIWSLKSLSAGWTFRNWLGYLRNYIVEFNHWRIRQEFSNPWLECLYQADKHNKKVFYCFCKNRIELKNRKMGIKGSLLSLLLTLTTLVEIIIIWVLQFLSFYFLNLNRNCHLICRPGLFFRVNRGCKFYA